MKVKFCVAKNVGNLLTSFGIIGSSFNTLRTGDADLRFYITTVQDE